MSLLERIGLGSIIGLLFRASISVVSSLLAFVAGDCGHVPGLKLLTRLTIAPIVISISMAVVVTIEMSIEVIGSKSTTVGVTMGVMVAAPVEVASMLVEMVASSVLSGVILLVRDLRVVLAAAELPLAVLFFPDVVEIGRAHV